MSRGRIFLLGVSDMLDADEIAPRIWQGSKPPLGQLVAQEGFDTLVLCAREYQPASVYFPGVQVVHAPNDDAPEIYPFTEENLKTAVRASGLAAQAVEKDHRVLVTCAAGINRSGLVVALMLHRLYGLSGSSCIQLVRRRRKSLREGQPKPLSNELFVKALERLPFRV